MANRWDVLTRFIRQNAYGRGVEIGGGKGLNPSMLMQLNPKIFLTVVDYWPAGYRGYSRKQADNHRRQFEERMMAYGHRFALIEKPSLDAVKEFADGSLDWVFIDADHTYEGCRADIVAWSPKVRKGGLICGHDYGDPEYPGVAKAAHEMFANVIAEDDFVWIAGS